MEKNPIPSMKVWFDQKDRKAVVCFDNSTPGAIANEACNNGEFHTHAWVPLGWLDMETFVNAAAPADLVAAFLRELCMTIGRIRLSWEDQEQRIRNLRKENFAALAHIEELEGAHIITDEQIDAAWERAEEWAYVQPDCLETLAELGIYACEAPRCKERGRYCSDCDGKGWKR